MAGPFDFTGQNIENTYQRVLQTPDGVTFYDGTGSLVNIGGGTGIPGGPNTSVQFNGNGAFSGSTNFTFNSASNALVLTGSLNVSGSTFQIGNNNLIGNTSLSGSINISGSSTIRGTTTMTGSLEITGSTTQVGNNTLFGNTILTGSISISGSFPVGSYSSSVNIYGDTSMTGYLKFNPQPTNIDTSISASYIYVSGSTNDLYFSQNGNGYVNTTRLRWLEGNLYTGLLNGGIISQVNTHTYQISSGSGIIVSLNASYNDNPYPSAQYVNWGNLTKTIDALSSSYDQQFVAIDSSSAIFAQGTPYSDGDYNTKIPIGIVIHQNRSTINALQTFPSVGYGWKQRSFDFIKAFGPLKVAGYTLAQSGSSTRGLVLSGGTAWVDGRNYIVDPNNPSYIVEATGITTSKIYRYYQSGSGWAYDTNAGAGYTDIDPTQYSNAGALTLVPTNDWSIQRVFYFPNSATKAFYIYYGNATYANKTDALSAVNTEIFSEAPNTTANAIYVGFMLLRNNANFNTAASYAFYEAGLFRSSGTGGAGGGGGATTLAALTDVSLSSLTYGDLLMYNASTGLWNNTHTLSGSYFLSGSLTTNDGLSVQIITASFISASGGITGSLYGTASYATTASYALNGGVTQLLAGPNISLSPTTGLGQVTISSTGGGGIYGNTATGSYGSFYSTQNQTASIASTGYPMFFDQTDISNGVSISGSTNTLIKVQNAGVYNIQFSAQLVRSTGAGTENVLIWLRKNGGNLAWTNTDVTFAGGTNVKQVAAWNWFVNTAANDYYEIVWSTTSTNISLEATTTPDPDVPSVILTVNRIDQFLSNTGSFTGSFTGELIGTASWASNAITASYVLNAVSASYATLAQTANTASYVLQAVSASYSSTASYVENAQTASYIVLAQTASYVLQAVSSSFATTSSYALTASYVNGSRIKSNAVSSGTFTGNPKKATVTFVLAYPDTNYSITITGEDARTWTIESKLAGSFVINANSNTALAGTTYWQTMNYGEFNS